MPSSNPPSQPSSDPPSSSSSDPQTDGAAARESTGATDESPRDTSGGTYSLLVEVVRDVAVEVGALGERSFDAGWYVYTGSARGAGGFARVRRHRELVAGERDARHWHLDYLLGADAARIDAVWTSPGVDRECAVAGDLPGAPVGGLGASDCDCEAHLVAAPSRERAVDALGRLHRRRGLPE